MHTIDDYKKQEEYFASDEYKQSFDKEVEKVEEVKEEKKNQITSESGRKYTKEQVIKMSKDY